MQIEGLRAEAEGALARASSVEREIQAKKKREVELFARDLKRRGEESERQAREAIEAAVAKLETAQKAAAAAPRLRGETIAAIREATSAVLRDPELGIPEEPELTGLALAVGARVRVKSLGVIGEITSLQGDEAEVAVSGKRLRVATNQLAGLNQQRGHSSHAPSAQRQPEFPRGAWGGGAPPAQGKPGRAVVVSGASPHDRAPSGSVSVLTKTIPSELNLIGLTVEDARERVDKLLDDAALSDRHEVRIVHGFGAGKLKKAVAQLLEKHPLVSSWRLGGPGEGGGGATVVELKD